MKSSKFQQTSKNKKSKRSKLINKTKSNKNKSNKKIKKSKFSKKDKIKAHDMLVRMGAYKNTEKKPYQPSAFNNEKIIVTNDEFDDALRAYSKRIN